MSRILSLSFLITLLLPSMALDERDCGFLEQQYYTPPWFIGYYGFFKEDYASIDYQSLVTDGAVLVAVPRCTTISNPYTCDFVDVSYDGVTWESIEIDSDTHYTEAIWADGLFIVLTTDPIFYTSRDGMTWQSHASPGNVVLSSVAYNGERYVAVGPEGPAVFSEDGITWTATESNIFLKQIASNGVGFVGLSDSNTYLSPDGINWEIAPYTLVPRDRGLAFAAGLYMIGGGQGQLYTSVDGVTWETSGLETTQGLSGILEVDGILFVIDEGGLMFSSRDGQAWYKHHTGYYDTVKNPAVFQGRLMATSGANIWGNDCILSKSQAPLITHVTRQDGDFKTEMVIANPFSESKAYTLTGYDSSGNQLGSVDGSLEAGRTVSQGMDVLFPDQNVSHISVAAPELRVWSVYRTAAGETGPVQLAPNTQRGRGWWLLPDESGNYWEGIAVVNMGAAVTDVMVSQIAANGAVIETRTAVTGLAPMGKGLYVLNFPLVEGAQYRFSSDQPLAAIALRGQGQIFWESALIAETN